MSHFLRRSPVKITGAGMFIAASLILFFVVPDKLGCPQIEAGHSRQQGNAEKRPSQRHALETVEDGRGPPAHSDSRTPVRGKVKKLSVLQVIKDWNGRRESSPQPSAWKILPHGLKIENI